MWRFVLVVCGACGRIAFDERIAIDGTPPGPDCWPAWRSGAPAFASVGPITELADPDKDGNPWLTADGRTLYWDNGTGNTEIYRATRMGPGQPFGARTQVTELTSPFEETGLVMTGDDRVGVVASSRTGSMGFDLWQVTRNGGVFATPTRTEYNAINNDLNQFDAFLTADGKRLYYASSAATGQVLLQSSRGSTADAFATPVPIPGTGTFAVEADPDLSPDELVLVFSATVPLTLHAAVRGSTAAGFGAPFPLTSIVGGNYDGDPALSANGCELFFISDRGGNRDLWRAVVSP